MNYGLYAPNSGRVVNAQLKVLIADITLTNNGSFEMIPIPAGITSLEITGVFRSTQSAAAANLFMYCNGDYTETNYSNQLLNAFSTTVSTSRSDVAGINVITAGTSAANDFTPVTIWLPFADRIGLKNANALGGERQSGTTHVIRIVNWQWESTEPVRNLTFRTDSHPTNLFAAGSRLQLFGLGTFAVALAR